MKGSRPLTAEEIKQVIAHFEQNPNKELALRNLCLFVLGINTGFRIKELLSVKIENVLRNDGKIADSLSVERKNMKGKRSGRTVPLNSQAKEYIKRYLDHCQRKEGWLFVSQKCPEKPILPNSAWRIFSGYQYNRKGEKEPLGVYKQLDLDGKLGTHSMRKTLAKKAYDVCEGNIIDIKEALGHASVNSTINYVQFNNERVAKVFE